MTEISPCQANSQEFKVLQFNKAKKSQKNINNKSCSINLSECYLEEFEEDYNLYELFRYVKRANAKDDAKHEWAKFLSAAARTLASIYKDKLANSITGKIAVSSVFISSITDVKAKMNNRYHKELADIFDVKFYQKIEYDKNCYLSNVFIVSYTDKAREIINCARTECNIENSKTNRGIWY